MLPAPSASGLPEPPKVPAPATRHEHDLERLVQALRANGGRLSAAATAIGISRQRAYRLLGGRSVEDLLR